MSEMIPMMRPRREKAKSVPTESCPVAASQTPRNRQTAYETYGTIVSHIHRCPSMRALSISVSRRVDAWSVKPSSACRPRPKALSTRMPWIDCSTVVARSPAWSCAEREMVK